MPRPAIRVGVGVGRLGQRLVDTPALLRNRRAVHRRAHQRMAEAHLRPEVDKARLSRRRLGTGVDAQVRGRSLHQQRVADRVCRGDEEQRPRRGRQRGHLPLEALLDLARQRRPIGQPEPARELGRRPPARQLQQRQRVTVRLGHDAIAQPIVERAGDHRFQQLLGIDVIEPADDELGQPVQMPRGGGLTHAQQQRHGLGSQTTRHEGEHLCRRRIEPLRVVDDADQRTLLGGVREQAQHGQADEEPIRRRAGTQAEGGAQCLALRDRQVLEPHQERRAELLQPREGEPHLGFDARRSCDGAP
jgi:hypothetical protein